MNVTDLESLAARLATEYLNHLRSNGGQGYRPWSLRTPIQETKVWKYFLQTAEVVQEMEADPRKYMTAQFVALRKWKQSQFAFPWPQQLFTDSARIRYIEWQQKQAEREDSKTKPIHVAVDPLKLEEKKLSALCNRFNLKAQDVLIMCSSQFSERFLAKKGVLDSVRKLSEQD